MGFLLRVMIEFDILQMRARGLIRRLPNGDLVSTDKGMAKSRLKIEIP